MPQREYDITIGPSGEVEVHVRGYKGKRCLDALKFFQHAVGDVKSRSPTSEFYEPDEDVTIHQEQQR